MIICEGRFLLSSFEVLFLVTELLGDLGVNLKICPRSAFNCLIGFVESSQSGSGSIFKMSTIFTSLEHRVFYLEAFWSSIIWKQYSLICPRRVEILMLLLAQSWIASMVESGTVYLVCTKLWSIPSNLVSLKFSWVNSFLSLNKNYSKIQKSFSSCQATDSLLSIYK